MEKFLTKLFLLKMTYRYLLKENDSVKSALNLLSDLQNCFSFSMSGSAPTCFGLFKNINEANDSFDKNIKKFRKNGFDAWVCKLQKNGVSFI